jgi:hypothetical protein
VRDELASSSELTMVEYIRARFVVSVAGKILC